MIAKTLLLLSMFLSQGVVFAIYDFNNNRVITPLPKRDIQKIYSWLGRTTSDSGMVKVYVRSCGMITVFKNKLNETPEAGVFIKFNVSQCQIDDWQK